MKVGIPNWIIFFYLQLELHLVFSYGVWAKFSHNSKLDEQLMQGLQAIETSFLQAVSSAVEGSSQATLYWDPSEIFDLFPWPTSVRHRFQITEEPALRPFSHTEYLIWNYVTFWGLLHTL